MDFELQPLRTLVLDCDLIIEEYAFLKIRCQSRSMARLGQYGYGVTEIQQSEEFEDAAIWRGKQIGESTGRGQ